MTDEFEISDEPPRDEDGHPIHPERGHRICGATKSDRTTPTEHGRERDDYEYCLLAAGWGEDRSVGPCSKHPVTGEQWGESNPNFKAGKTSEYFKSKLSDRQRDVYEEVAEALDDDADAKVVLSHFATRLLMLGEHAQDAAMLREGRQILSEFGIVETAAEKREVEHSGSIDGERTLGEEERVAIREGLASRRES